MNAKLLLAALIVALTTSLAAVAADPPAKETTTAPAETPAKVEAANYRLKRHIHMEERGGAAPTTMAEAKDQPKRPPHDHLKER